MIILLNLISLNNNIAQLDDQAVRRPGCATTARHDRAGWTGKNLILDEALMPPIILIRKSLFASLVCASTSTIVEIIVSN